MASTYDGYEIQVPEDGHAALPYMRHNLPLPQQAGSLLEHELVNGDRNTANGNRFITPGILPYCLWILACVVGIAFGGAILAYVLKDYKRDGQILEIVKALNFSCPACTVDLVVTNGCDNITYCDWIIQGSGPAGIYGAYRLGPHGVVCIIDDRDRIGGKVYSYTSVVNDTFVTPTCAEQIRSSDVILRCWYQELGIQSFARPTTGSYLEGFTRNRNWTAAMCNDDTMPPANPATCDWGEPSDRVAPNGDLDPNAFYQLPDLCPGQDWTECSFFNELDTLFFAGTPTNDETITQYGNRVLGHEGYSYYRDASVNLDIFDEDHSAKWVIDYLNYDFDNVSYNALFLPVGGPHAALEAALTHILGNNTRLFLGARVLAIEDVSAIDSVYTIQVNTTRGTFRGKRTIVSYPPYYIRDLKGDIGSAIATDRHITETDSTEDCTVNLFFSSKWWQPQRSQCLTGYCATMDNFAAGPVERQGMTWTFTDTSETAEIAFQQYIPTPERDASNELRVFPGSARCKQLNEVLKTNPVTGRTQITDSIMQALRLRFEHNGTTVSDLVDSWFEHEPAAYEGLSVGVTFDLFELNDYAKRPLPTVDLCIATTGVYTQHSGWQNGGIEAVHACFREQYLDVFTEEEIRSWEMCCNPNGNEGDQPTSDSSSNPLPECIDTQVPDTWAPCILLDGETHLRDYYDLCYCDACALSASGSSSDTPPPAPSAERVPRHSRSKVE